MPTTEENIKKIMVLWQKMHPLKNNNNRNGFEA